jgi:HK97 family phage major capsid protein
MDQVEEYEKTVRTLERQQRIKDSLEKPGDPLTVVKAGKIEMQQEKRDKFGSLGEQLVAIINAGRVGGTVDPRLRVMGAATGLGETIPSDGGFLIQKDFTTKVYEDLFNNGLVAGKCQKIPISGQSNGTVINGFDESSRASSTAGGVIIYWSDEAGTKTASKPKFRRVELNLKKMIGLCYLTDEMIMDAATIEATVSNAFRLAMDYKLQDGIINGNGAGMPLGILAAGCLVSVAAEAGQGADTILMENIVKMYARRFAAQTMNYEWYYNQDIEPQLLTMSLSVGTGGGPVYLPPGGLSQVPYGQIMGRPAHAIEQCATLGDKGDIIFADFKDGYLLAEKGGIKQDTSIHVEFLTDQTALRFVLRVDGQPWRASALTPMKGSNTQSHFITLDAR